jgi:hypothetical protein
VVLLSPACASFDQFQDYEHRGRVFKELVEKLAEEGALQPAPAPPVAARDSAPGVGAQPQPDVAVPEEPPEAGRERVAETAEPSAPQKSAEVALQSQEPFEGRSEPAASEASPPDPEAAKPPAAAAEPRELVYVYEVAAEDVSYPEAVQPGPEDEFEPIILDELRPPESLEDEALPFEVRETSSQGNGRSQESDKEVATKIPKDQTRLPGI